MRFITSDVHPRLRGWPDRYRRPRRHGRTIPFLLILGAAVWALLSGLFVSPVLAQTTQVSKYARASSGDWSNSGKGTGAEDDDCTAIGAENKTIDLTNFGFTIPTGATITGIKVELKVARQHEGNLTVQLLKAGTPTSTPAGTAKTFTAPTPDPNICNNSSFVPQGDCADLWGTTWSPSDINASGFGVRVDSSTSTGSRVLDAVRITICYTTPAPECGNKEVEPGEQCDLGSNNGQSGSCCTSSCQFASSGTLCRAAAGECDVAEYCTGMSATCPADQLKSSGTLCRDAAGVCDEKEYCTGTSADCPADQLKSSGTVCRAAAGECDVAESCTGMSATCPGDQFKSSGTLCRDAAGVCDEKEYCTGTSATCPADQLKSSGTVCRDAAGECDVAESCTGMSATCPGDQLKSSGTLCRDAAGECDEKEYCTGTSADCPENKFKPDKTPCTDDGKACTDDVCSNGSCTHPLKSKGTSCHPGDNCPATEACTGQSPDCPFPDDDGDGVRNACDSCPTTPAGMCQNLMTVGAVSFSFTGGQSAQAEELGEAIQSNNNMGVLVTDYANDLVWVYLSKGDGRFQRFRSYAVGEGPIALAVGDVNRDGKTDWVAANYLSSTLSVALGNGDGTFGRIFTLFLIEGENPSSLAMGDFNGDGRLDVAVANFVSNNVTVLRGQGDGGFLEALSIPLFGQGPSAIVTADFNLDGALDLAVADMLSNEVSLLIGDGKGMFREAQRIPVGEAPVALGVADFNRDGRPDLVTASFNGNGLSLLFSRSGVSRSLSFTRTDISLDENPVAVVTGEFMPKTPGIAAVHLSLGEISLVHVQQGQALQRNVRRMSVMVPNPTSLTLGDFNNDGLLDIVVVGSPFGELTTLLGKGDGTFVLKR